MRMDTCRRGIACSCLCCRRRDPGLVSDTQWPLAGSVKTPAVMGRLRTELTVFDCQILLTVFSCTWCSDEALVSGPLAPAVNQGELCWTHPDNLARSAHPSLLFPRSAVVIYPQMRGHEWTLVSFWSIRMKLVSGSVCIMSPLLLWTLLLSLAGCRRTRAATTGWFRSRASDELHPWHSITARVFPSYLKARRSWSCCAISVLIRISENGPKPDRNVSPWTPTTAQFWSSKKSWTHGDQQQWGNMPQTAAASVIHVFEELSGQNWIILPQTRLMLKPWCWSWKLLFIY